MFSFRPDLMIKVLPVMGYGMMGVFIVTGIIIAAVALLNRLNGSE